MCQNVPRHRAAPMTPTIFQYRIAAPVHAVVSDLAEPRNVQYLAREGTDRAILRESKLPLRCREAAGRGVVTDPCSRTREQMPARQLVQPSTSYIAWRTTTVGDERRVNGLPQAVPLNDGLEPAVIEAGSFAMK